MELTVKISKEQEWVLDKQFKQISTPYGYKIVHIGYVNSSRSYLTKEQLKEFVRIREELSQLGLLRFIHMDNGTLRFYELTEIGLMFYIEVNK